MGETKGAGHTLTDKIGYDPVLFSLLYVFNTQRSQFRPAQPAPQQNR
jgi:hypothetical protein